MQQAAQHGTLVYLYLHRNNQAATFLKLNEECECPLGGEKIKDKNKLQNPGLDKKHAKVSKLVCFFSRGVKYQ